jgi:hypothetical protein
MMAVKVEYVDTTSFFNFVCYTPKCRYSRIKRTGCIRGYIKSRVYETRPTKINDLK